MTMRISSNLPRQICGNPMAQVREPEFMMFLTGRGGKAYRRNDGILVVPIATFGA